MTHTIKHAKTIQRKSRTHDIRQVDGNIYSVTSGASRKQYKVVLSPYSGGTCTCDWAKYRPRNDLRSGCSHVVSVLNYIEQDQERVVSAWTDETQAQRQHRPTQSIGDGVILTSRRQR